MDRRQRKTRNAIFSAFTELLSEKDFGRITVGEIIHRADIGRATFYAHFETKEFLLKALCRELFCHIFDAEHGQNPEHSHIFACDAPDSVFLHLIQHLQRDDNKILQLLSSQNNELFLKYFKTELYDLVESQLHLFENRRNVKLPDDFWIDHIASVFVNTIAWWVDNGRKESSETIAEYFVLAV